MVILLFAFPLVFLGMLLLPIVVVDLMHLWQLLFFVFYFFFFFFVGPLTSIIHSHHVVSS